MSVGRRVPVNHVVTALSRVERNRILRGYLGDSRDMDFRWKRGSLELLQRKSEEVIA